MLAIAGQTARQNLPFLRKPMGNLRGNIGQKIVFFKHKKILIYIIFFKKFYFFSNFSGNAGHFSK